MHSYLETTKNVYKDAAINPNRGLCCTTTPIWQFPGLEIPSKMLEMNYGCGSTVNPKDLFDDKKWHILLQNQPLGICDKTATALASLSRDDIFISPFHLFL